MSFRVKGLDVPEHCAGCWFATEAHTFPCPGRTGVFIKIARCKIAPEYVGDPYFDIYKDAHAPRPEWCPCEPEGEEENDQ